LKPKQKNIFGFVEIAKAPLFKFISKDLRNPRAKIGVYGSTLTVAVDEPCGWIVMKCEKYNQEYS